MCIFLKKCNNAEVRVPLAQTCFDQNHAFIGYLEMDEVT